LTPMLFDKLSRKDNRPRKYAEPLFAFLNRSPQQDFREIRNLLESWFSHYPSVQRNSFRTRFCSDDDLSHQCAFFELYMHELLLKMDYEIEIHPDVEGVGTHPEFLVRRKGKSLFFLECTLARGSKDDVAAQKRESILYDTLDKTNSPNFFLEIEITKYTTMPPPGAIWRKTLEKNLLSLAPDDPLYQLDDPDLLPKWKLKDRGWEVIFTPIPKQLEARGKSGIRPVGVTWFGPTWIKDHIRIKKSIKEKATKYGSLGLPYIIAVNVISHFTDNISIECALFGDEIIKVHRNPDGSFAHEPGRRKNGSWIGPKGPQNRGVSAAVIFSYLLWGNITKIAPILWHNPWAQNPLSSEFWCLPQKKVNLNNGHIETIAGKRIFDIFALPENWPIHNETA
jgi:hypothetical protein